ncbi:glycosyltransferase family 39 protein [Desulfocicer vacuolatum]
MSYSYYPMNLDLLYMVSLYLGSDIAPKFIHFAFALMTAVLIFRYLKKRMDSIWGLGGVFLFLSIPIIIKLSITVYVDLGLMFFSTAALLALVKWIESKFKLQFLLLAGACCGLAMGTKYNGLIVFFLLTMFVTFIFSRFNRQVSKAGIKSIAAGLIFGLVALTVFSPWMIRNYIWTKNPVYPLYNKFFNVEMNPACPIRLKNVELKDAEKKNINIGRFAYRKFMYNEEWWETALLPIRIFFQGKDNDFKFFDGRLSALLLILPVFAFVASHGKNDLYRVEKFIFLAFCGLFILFTMVSSGVRIRYLSPAIPSLVILSLYGLKNLMDNKCYSRQLSFIKRMGPFVLVFAMALYMVWNNGGYLVEQFKYVKPCSYISGMVSRDSYIKDFRHEYAAFQYINEHLPLDSKVMFFYIGKRGYFCNREYFPDEGGNIEFLYTLLRFFTSPLKIKQEFQKRGITHLMINNFLFKQRLYTDFKQDKKKLFLEFINNLNENLFDANGFSVYKIKL